MKDWNVVATVHRRGFVRGCELLEELGEVARTDFHNVLVLRARDPLEVPEAVRGWILEDPGVRSVLARVVPVTVTFPFRDAEEFRARAAAAVRCWVPDLLGKAFHVRMHRRGFRGRLRSPEEERRLDELLLGELEARGGPGRIAFEDPDAVIALETVGGRAGLSLWRREALRRYPLLGLD
ncbi:hypothetical protein G3N55_07590 [Dissulfurirhabdus thermomarina]|uniref:THUMP domain-containing protein n=1 Tax=Dissulfurirhabdus thermomarina TaxID=1765737 RepID=A0A6N9TN28_DISTH|nr:hypothetical protein [Dissulfurirhabdus thermomarina]NDY42701.1 hypothetical protein [Dissulfurirhabdus thermomarina]NMX24292.1 hypothetical protein [Dissulfurirhabdus thermomarina]